LSEIISPKKQFNKIWRILPIILIIILSMSTIYNIYQYKIINTFKSENQLIEKELQHKYLKRPSMIELEEFLAKEQSSENKNLSESELASNLRLNAHSAGYNMCIVFIDFEIILSYRGLRSPPIPFTYVINGITLENGTFVYIFPEGNFIIGNEHSQIKDLLEYIMRNIALYFNYIRITKEIRLY